MNVWQASVERLAVHDRAVSRSSGAEHGTTNIAVLTAITREQTLRTDHGPNDK